jgi:hypothetical protein
VAVVVEDEVYDPDEQANHQTNWDNYITIIHHVLGAKSQKLSDVTSCDIYYKLLEFWTTCDCRGSCIVLHST